MYLFPPCPTHRPRFARVVRLFGDSVVSTYLFHASPSFCLPVYHGNHYTSFGCIDMTQKDTLLFQVFLLTPLIDFCSHQLMPCFLHIGGMGGQFSLDWGKGASFPAVPCLVIPQTQGNFIRSTFSLSLFFWLSCFFRPLIPLDIDRNPIPFCPIDDC